MSIGKLYNELRYEKESFFQTTGYSFHAICGDHKVGMEAGNWKFSSMLMPMQNEFNISPQEEMYL